VKCLKCDLKVWNRDVFGHLDIEKKRVLKEIEVLNNQDDGIEFGDQVRMKRLDLLGQLKVINKKCESLHRQKARTNWFVHGDANTRFYHIAIRWRRLKNEVKGVNVGGQWCEVPEVVRREAKMMFEERFTAKRDFGIGLDNVYFKSLSADDSMRIISTASEEEVKEAVWMCEGSKSPCPDAITSTLLNTIWRLLSMIS